MSLVLVAITPSAPLWCNLLVLLFAESPSLQAHMDYTKYERTRRQLKTFKLLYDIETLSKDVTL
jgi:hypothetical protein